MVFDPEVGPSIKRWNVAERQGAGREIINDNESK
jgi:hypothetical protein